MGKRFIMEGCSGEEYTGYRVEEEMGKIHAREVKVGKE